MAGDAAFRRYAEDQHSKDLLRLITCGSVDDGKSTLIGRMLYESHLVFEDHLAALWEHAPDLRVHTVLADPRSVPDLPALRRFLDGHGARLVVAEVARGDGTPRHDPGRLGTAYQQVFEERPEAPLKGD